MLFASSNLLCGMLSCGVMEHGGSPLAQLRPELDAAHSRGVLVGGTTYEPIADAPFTQLMSPGAGFVAVAGWMLAGLAAHLADLGLRFRSATAHRRSPAPPGTTPRTAAFTRVTNLKQL